MIAGSRATAGREPRQVRKEATAAADDVCRGVPGYHMFLLALTYIPSLKTYLILNLYGA